ncbi:MAG: tyrosine-type recombinase/integrase [Defluviitaleaceae bacterium]|nr:tyrosine-type recombinase/integrase [Defluviitaleaceae bacterium]
MSYHEEKNRENIARLREIQRDLPDFMGEYFRARGDYTATKTRLAYAYDLKIFFGFLTTETREFGGINVPDFSIEDLGQIRVSHIEEFMEYLSYYVKDKEITNEQSGKSRKLSALRSVFAFFYSREKIPANPAELVKTPPTKGIAKIYLDAHEIALMLDNVESGEGLTDKQRDYHKATNARDLAILTLLAGTGIRVSECVGLNISDINMDDNSFRVVRKGGDEAALFFGDEVRDALGKYLVDRQNMVTKPGHQDALFLSMQMRRMTDRAIQNMVKKYADLLGGYKNISPHKLRKSFGTHMYRQTGDIYLVADLLGHRDVKTTTKHYADSHEDRGRKALKEFKLRD